MSVNLPFIIYGTISMYEGKQIATINYKNLLGDNKQHHIQPFQ